MKKQMVGANSAPPFSIVFNVVGSSYAISSTYCFSSDIKALKVSMLFS